MCWVLIETNNFSKHDEEWDDNASRKYYLHPRFKDPVVAANQLKIHIDVRLVFLWIISFSWNRISGDLSSVAEQSSLNHDSSPPQSLHITDEYFREFGTKTTSWIDSLFFQREKKTRLSIAHILAARTLRGELCKTYGTVQSGPKSNCLPIGIALMNDELTLLSCDVHRDAQNIRLFDIQSGRLKHTITSDQVKIKIERIYLVFLRFCFCSRKWNFIDQVPWWVTFEIKFLLSNVISFTWPKTMVVSYKRLDIDQWNNSTVWSSTIDKKMLFELWNFSF